MKKPPKKDSRITNMNNENRILRKFKINKQKNKNKSIAASLPHRDEYGFGVPIGAKPYPKRCGILPLISVCHYILNKQNKIILCKSKRLYTKKKQHNYLAF